jgi:hypothetical protein
MTDKPEAAGNAASNITPEQFQELYRGEATTLVRPILPRRRRLRKIVAE